MKVVKLLLSASPGGFVVAALLGGLVGVGATAFLHTMTKGLREPSLTPGLLFAALVLVQLVLAVGVPIALIFLHPTSADGHYPAPDAITPMAAMAGFGVGLIMERGSVRFRVEGGWWRRGLRYLLGLIIIGLFYAGPRLILPESLAYGLEAVLRFVRYALVGWAATFLCPWLFVRLRLASQTES